MITFLLRRVVLAIPTLAGVLLICFVLFHVVPGDPIDILLGDLATGQDREALRAELGLDLPFWQQSTRYFSQLLQFDLGQSYLQKRPVREILFERWPATLELGAASLLLAALFGISLGVISSRRAKWRDLEFFDSLATIFYSVPGVFLGPVLTWIFAMKLEWLPVSERGGLSHLILPAASLALPMGAYLFRMTRVSLKDELRADYIRTARAKGLSETRIFFLHLLRNVMTPLISTLGLQAGAVLTGTVVTETIFDWPGLGTLLYQSIHSRDLPVVEGAVLLVALTYISVNLITDIAYGWAHPQMRELS